MEPPTQKPTDNPELYKLFVVVVVVFATFQIYSPSHDPQWDKFGIEANVNKAKAIHCPVADPDPELGGGGGVGVGGGPGTTRPLP